MATNLSLTTSYVGEVAGDYIFRAFMAQESLQHLTVRPNIGYKQIVRKMASEVDFAAATCDFTPDGTVTITERLITLEKFQVQRQLCKNDFIQTWEALKAQNGDIGTTADALVDLMLAAIAEKNETLIWQGVNATTGQYDGFMTLFDADGSVNKVAAPEVITPSNVLAKIILLIDELPYRVKSASEKPLLYFSQDVWEDYMYAQQAAGNGWYITGGPTPNKTYMGLYDIVVAPGMPANSMVFAQKSNLWFGTNKLSDWNTVKVLDMEDHDLSENVRFSAKFYAAVQYGYSDEIAVYAPGIS